MNRARPAFACALAVPCALLVAPCYADGNGHGGDDHEIPGQVIVRVGAGHTIAEVRDRLRAVTEHPSPTQIVPAASVVLFNYELEWGQPQSAVDALLSVLTNEGVINWGESNRVNQSAEGQTGSLWVTGLNDLGMFRSQYAVDSLGLNSAWQRTGGALVTVAIIDSGIDITHEAVQGPQGAGSWDFINLDGNPADEGDGIDNDADGLVDEAVGHGTFVSSIIRLVAPHARQVHIRAMDGEGQATTFRTAAAIHYAIDLGAQVINVSLASLESSDAMADACARAKSHGTIVLSAIGNMGALGPLHYPACDPNSFGIGASTVFETRGTFSNYGSHLDLLAPGATVGWPDGTLDQTTSILGAAIGGGYAYWEGTSFATAFASGCAALVRAQYPDWPDAITPESEIANRVMQILSQTATNIDATEPALAGLLGHGVIDAAAATAIGPNAPQLADLNHDGAVNGIDLGEMLVSWGECDGCVAELTGDGQVDGADLTIIFSDWD